MLMIIMLLRRSERLGINVMLFVLILRGGEWCEEGARQWCEARRGVENS
jgi:hypothetical protein